MTIAGRAEAAGEPPVSPVGRTSPQPRPRGTCLRFAPRDRNMEARGRIRRGKKSLYHGCFCVK